MITAAVDICQAFLIGAFGRRPAPSALQMDGVVGQLVRDGDGQ